jgi:hypothetical protein
LNWPLLLQRRQIFVLAQGSGTAVRRRCFVALLNCRNPQAGATMMLGKASRRSDCLFDHALRCASTLHDAASVIRRAQ